jgi:MFS family permease
MLIVVLQLQLGLHADVLTAGLSLLPWSVGLGVASFLAGSYLVPRYGARVMFAGLAVLLVGVLGAITVYATSSATAYPWPLLPALGISGLGLGLFTTPFFTVALSRVRPPETGSAAGLLNAVQQLGGTLGVALLGTVFLHTLTGGGNSLDAAQRACWLAVGLLVATGVAVAVLVSPVSRPDHEAR